MKKRIVILGAAESGVGAALLAQQQGYDVFVSDAGIIKENYKTELLQHAVAFEEGMHTEEKILNAAEIIKSPGISDESAAARRCDGIPLSGRPLARLHQACGGIAWRQSRIHTRQTPAH